MPETETMQDIPGQYDFFEYVDGGHPAPSRELIDVAILDMNHAWPNVGHDSLVHAVLEAAEELREPLVAAGAKVRVISFDVRRRLEIPAAPNGQFRLYVGTGGPGHLDPRLNDGVSDFSQGIAETSAWEAPLFRLFDAILAVPEAALIGVCHTFGLMCRWSGLAHAELRGEKSSGMPINELTGDGVRHPWFAEFAERLADGRHFRVVDNRLFDLVLDDARGAEIIAHEPENEAVLTMVELARDAAGTMSRILGVNHHPEIIDREHIMRVLDEKRALGEVSEQWYRERAGTMRDLFKGEQERQSRLTSEFTLLAPLRYHLRRLVEERVA
ncbi:MAG TPA: hypothetical protein VG323_08945 [Thermoanaerobaculia bacterium]|nr:hypothetical protein [Thermoanaerobaculia bacterium]